MSTMRSRRDVRFAWLAAFHLILTSAVPTVASAQCDPEYIAHVGGTPSSIFASGNRGYLGFPGALRIINTANPAAPTLMGETLLPGEAGRMALLAGHLYIAMEDAGVAVVDVGVPSNPSLLTTIAGSNSTHVAAANGLLFVIRDGDLRIYDIAVPSAPVLRSTYSLGATDLEGVAVAGTTVYVLTEQDEIQTLSVANPALPVVVATYAMATSSINEDLALRGNLLAALTWDGAELIDIANPAALAYRGLAPADSIADSVAFGQSGGATLLYLEGDFCSVYAYDVTNPAVPVRRAEISGACSATVAASGSTLFIADSEGVEAYDFTVPTASQLVYASVAVPDFSQGLAAIDTHVCVLSRPDLLLIYDVADPLAPQLVHSHTLGGLGHEIVRIGRTAYIAEYVTANLPDATGRLEILDLTNPVSPVLLGAIDADSYFVDLAVQDGVAAAVTGDGTLELFNVSDPSAIVRLGRLPDAGQGRVFFASNYVLIADFYDGVRVIDVSDPNLPSLVTTHAPRSGEFLDDLVVRDQTAFVLQTDGRIDILDVSDPVNPDFRSSIVTTNAFYSLGIAGSLLVINVDAEKLRFFDTSDPANPVQLPIESIGGWVHRCDMSNGVLWAVGINDGLFGVRAPALPRLRQWPADAVACPAGTPIEFSVRLDNPVGATFQWSRAGAPVVNGVTASGAIISGAATRTLTITAPGLAELGEYACTVTNACGTITTSPARLALGVPPVVLNQPDAQTACYRASAVFQTTGLGTAPFAFQWQHESPAGSGLFLPLVDGPAAHHTVIGATARTLTLAPNPGQTLPNSLETTYRCVISNACGSITTAPALLSACRADYNCSAEVSVQDLFDFLDDWFLADAKANFNGVGAVTVQDLFDFLDSWFLGC